MEKQECQQDLCTNSCGFFGTSSQDGMCSKCHKSVKKSTPSHNFKGNRRMHQDLVTATTQQSPESRVHHEKTSNTPDMAGNSTNLEASKFRESVTDSNVIIESESTSNSREMAEYLAELPSLKDQDENLLHGVERSKNSQQLRDDMASEDGEQVGSSRSSSKDSRPSSANQNYTKIIRCKECQKRVGLTGYSCRCEGIFCATHRYSDVHKCQFDYKALGTEEIRRNNPVVKGDKVRKF